MESRGGRTRVKPAKLAFFATSSGYRDITVEKLGRYKSLLVYRKSEGE
jgi:hypothetical protein